MKNTAFRIIKDTLLLIALFCVIYLTIELKIMQKNQEAVKIYTEALERVVFEDYFTPAKEDNFEIVKIKFIKNLQEEQQKKEQKKEQKAGK